MLIQPTSFVFTLLLGFLAAVPYSGIDINLPALSATGAALGASASDVGLTMSAFVLSLAVMPLIWGAASDRFGRKPIVLFGTSLFVAASAARISPARRPLSAIASSYGCVLTHPISVGYILVGAAAGATVFAYVSGAPLFFLGVVGLSPQQYGLIFSACSAAVMCGAILDGRLGRRGVASAGALAIGLKLMASGSIVLLAVSLAGWTSPALVAALLIVVALAFGLSVPNAMNATMAPLPEIAGAVSAAATSIQLTAGSASSGLVSVLLHGRSALSMAAVMALCSLLGLGTYLLVARRAALSRQAISLEGGH